MTTTTTTTELEALLAEYAEASAEFEAGGSDERYLALMRQILAARPTEPRANAALLRWLVREEIGIAREDRVASLEHIAARLERLAYLLD
jgi:hypothetical protein